VRQVKVRFADEQKSYTQAFERLALELSRPMTIQTVAGHLGVSWDVIKGIQKSNLQRRFRQLKLRKVKRIAIDEIYLGKRMGYLTVVLDLQRGAVIFVGKGKGGETLEPFWKHLN
jgi:transposase